MDLSTLLSYVREQLEQSDADRTKAGKKPLFELTGLDLELNVTLTESNNAKGGFDLKVITAGAGTTTKTEEVQKITLRWVISPQAKSARIPGAVASNRSGKSFIRV